MNEWKSFDHMNPPKAVTDPQGLGLLAYPRHLHKAGHADDGGPLYVVVTTPQQEADALAEGWLREKPNPYAELAESVVRGPAPRRKG